MEPQERMISYQDLQPFEVEKKKDVVKPVRFKRSVAREWIAIEKTKCNSDTASTASTEDSESHDYDDDSDAISEISYQETSFETLDLSTTPTATAESYWDKIVQDRMKIYGMRNRRTAEAYFNKGRAYLVIHDYDTAYSDFSISASILLWIYGPESSGRRQELSPSWIGRFSEWQTEHCTVSLRDCLQNSPRCPRTTAH